MFSNSDPTFRQDIPMLYGIRVKGHLGPEWKPWFEGVSITQMSNGHTLLLASVEDQAALFGLLRKVRDLGLPLISLNCLDLN